MFQSLQRRGAVAGGAAAVGTNKLTLVYRWTKPGRWRLFVQLLRILRPTLAAPQAQRRTRYYSLFVYCEKYFLFENVLSAISRSLLDRGRNDVFCSGCHSIPVG